MSDDTHDDMINLDDPSEYEDPVSQRAMAFCHVAKLADTVQNEAVKELCLTMLRKLNASIRTPSTADLRPLKGGTSRCLARPRADRSRADTHFEEDARDGQTLNFDDPAPVEPETACSFTALKIAKEVDQAALPSSLM